MLELEPGMLQLEPGMLVTIRIRTIPAWIVKSNESETVYPYSCISSNVCCFHVDKKGFACIDLCLRKIVTHPSPEAENSTFEYFIISKTGNNDKGETFGF